MQVPQCCSIKSCLLCNALRLRPCPKRTRARGGCHTSLVCAQEQPGACAGCPSVVTMDLGLEGLPEAQQKELTQRIEEMQVKDRCAGVLASR
jgi:hypothetical protein